MSKYSELLSKNHRFKLVNLVTFFFLTLSGHYQQAWSKKSVDKEKIFNPLALTESYSTSGRTITIDNIVFGQSHSFYDFDSIHHNNELEIKQSRCY